MYQFGDRAAIFRDYFPPGEAAEHGEVDSAEAETGDQDVYAVAESLVVE